MNDDNEKSTFFPTPLMTSCIVGFQSWKSELFEAQEKSRVPWHPGKGLYADACETFAKRGETFFVDSTNLIAQERRALEIGEKVHSEMARCLKDAGFVSGDATVSIGGCFCDVHGSGHAPRCPHAGMDVGRDANVWVSADGRHTPIAELGNRHIVNILRLMDRGERGLDRSSPQWPLILAEIQRRGLAHGVVGVGGKPKPERDPYCSAICRLAPYHSGPCVSASGRVSSTRPSLQDIPREKSVFTLDAPDLHPNATRLHGEPDGTYTLKIIDCRTVKCDDRRDYNEFVLEHENGRIVLWRTRTNSPTMGRFLHCAGRPVIGSLITASVKNITKVGKWDEQTIRVINWSKQRTETP